MRSGSVLLHHVGDVAAALVYGGRVTYLCFRRIHTETRPRTSSNLGRAFALDS